jgi:preprotein translocase subunit SecB
MQIRFSHIQFTELNYKVATFDKEVTHELDTSLVIGNIFSDDEKRDFAIVFDFALQNSSEIFKLTLKAIAHFSTQSDIDEDFKNSAFVNINAPAIAFPYVRTFISNLTLNSGYDPIVLPAFNFLQLAEEKLT